MRVSRVVVRRDAVGADNGAHRGPTGRAIGEDGPEEIRETAANVGESHEPDAESYVGVTALDLVRLRNALPGLLRRPGRGDRDGEAE